jgi:MFS family permease
MSITLVVRIFIPCALGYFLASIFRSINAVIAPDLVRDLGLSASELGFASSAFYLISILMQLPYGVLLDRLDPRKLYASFLLFGALGAIISAFANGVYMLFFGRALIALGASAGAVTAFKIYSMWYEPERLPLVNGMTVAAGGMGLMAGTAPVAAALHVIDWRDVHLIVAGLLFIAAVLVPIIAPVKKSESAGITLFQQIKGFAVIFKSLVFWRAALYAAVTN